jgi:UDPglucose--hexose-1-phosphate uridylyltransferase
MAEFRKDPVIGRWVIVSPDRAKRPQHDAGAKQFTASDPCPFCAGNEAMTPPAVLAYAADSSRSDGSSWSVRVVPNKYPALIDEGPWIQQSNGIYQSATGVGVHEVIIESPEHVVKTQTLSENQIEKILSAYHDRIAQLRNDKRWRYVMIYKNQGVQGGATLEHIHSQLLALPIVPKGVREEITSAKRYHHDYGRCLYCRMIDQEIGDRARLVTEDERFVILCPFASRFPYETWILPKQHASSFESESNEGYVHLAHSLQETLIRLDRRLGNPSFNYIIHSNPLNEMENGYYHWHLEILPKLIQVAGFEWGSGSYINPVPPEDAARMLREALP